MGCGTLSRGFRVGWQESSHPVAAGRAMKRRQSRSCRVYPLGSSPGRGAFFRPPRSAENRIGWGLRGPRRDDRRAPATVTWPLWAEWHSLHEVESLVKAALVGRRVIFLVGGDLEVLGVMMIGRCQCLVGARLAAGRLELGQGAHSGGGPAPWLLLLDRLPVGRVGLELGLEPGSKARWHPCGACP